MVMGADISQIGDPIHADAMLCGRILVCVAAAGKTLNFTFVMHIGSIHLGTPPSELHANHLLHQYMAHAVSAQALASFRLVFVLGAHEEADEWSEDEPEDHEAGHGNTCDLSST